MLRIERLVEIVPAGRVFLVCGDIEHFAGNEFKLTDKHGVLADNAEGRDFSDRIDGGADTEFEAFKEQLIAAGLNDYLAIYQKAFDRYLANLAAI